MASRAATLEWVDASTPALLLTPCCEVASGVRVSDHGNFFWAHPRRRLGGGGGGPPKPNRAVGLDMLKSAGKYCPFAWPE